MALSIISQPPALAPVRQPLRLVLETNNFQLTAGTKARLRANFFGSLDTTLTKLTINGKAYSFTARNVPDPNSAFEYATNADTELALLNFVTMLQGNPFIADNYDITSSNFPFWFQLEAKQPGAQWTIQFENLTGLIVQSANVAGVAPTFRPNFKALLYLTAAGLTLQKDARVNAINRCEFILEELLYNLLVVAAPALNASTKSFALVEPMAYTLGYAESYGDDPLVQKRSTANYKALPGLFDKVNVPGSSIANYTTPTTNRSQWSNKPTVLRVKPHHVVLLAMYRTASLSQVDLLVQYRTTRPDGFLSATSTQSSDDLASYANEGIVCLYTSAAEINESTIGDALGNLYEISAQLRCTVPATPATNATSAPLVLEIDHSPVTAETVLLFKAASGLFEVVYFEGDTDQSVNTTRSLAEHLLPASYTRSQGEVREVEVTRQKRWVLHSGNRRRDFIVWLQELVGSDEVYMLSADLTQRTRVNIVAHSDDLTSTNQELFSMQVTIQEAFIDRV